jgi:hypothetical protein
MLLDFRRLFASSLHLLFTSNWISGGLGYLVVAVNPDFRSLGDLVVGTRVAYLDHQESVPLFIDVKVRPPQHVTLDMYVVIILIMIVGNYMYCVSRTFNL